MLRQSARFSRTLGVAAQLGCAVLVVESSAARAETIELRLASGNDLGIEYVDTAQQFFVPQVIRRVKERTGIDLKIAEYYGGSLVKATEVLDSVSGGKIDFGLFCICHEGKKLALNNFVFLAPFSSTDPVIAQRAVREVYRRVPELDARFEKDFNQKPIALMPLEPYDLLTTFPIKQPKDLHGHTVSGSGPNFPWMLALGTKVFATRGQHDHGPNHPDYDASLAFAQLVTSLKLYNKGMTHFVRTGLGAQVILVLTVNNDTLKRLPPEVQKIVIETASEYETLVTQRTKDNYRPHIDELAARGMTVSEFSSAEQAEWAQSLVSWSTSEIQKLDNAGLPASRAVRSFVAEQERLGHKWVVRWGNP
ncbi:MAG TPA: hypothetical protein VJ846_12435 [Sphingomicrobium sp.]|nr:hypothetical protein [Sphingomicrobium sp.]